MKIKEYQLLEAYMFNNSSFISKDLAKFNEVIDNKTFIDYIYVNWNDLANKELNLPFKINDDRNYEFDLGILDSYFEEKNDIKGRNPEFPSFFSSGTIFNNDAEFLIEIVSFLYKGSENDEKRNSLIDSIKLVKELVNGKNILFINSNYPNMKTKNDKDWKNIIGSDKFIVNENQLLYLAFLYVEIGSEFFIANLCNSLNDTYEIYFPYGIYTFKFMIHSLIIKNNLSREMGKIFELFMEKKFVKEGIAYESNVILNERDGKYNEELDGVVILEDDILIFEYKSALVDIFKQNDKTFEENYWSKFKSTFNKKDKSLKHTILDNPDKYNLISKQHVLLEDNLSSKKIHIIFVSNQFWWMNITTNNFESYPLLIDYNLFDLFLAQLGNDVKSLAKFHTYYKDHSKNDLLRYSESYIEQLFSDFLTPFSVTVSSEEEIKNGERIMMWMDSDFINILQRAYNVSKYFLKNKKSSVPFILITNKAIPYILWDLPNKNLYEMSYFDLSTRDKANLISKSKEKNFSFDEISGFKGVNQSSLNRVMDDFNQENDRWEILLLILRSFIANVN